MLNFPRLHNNHSIHNDHLVEAHATMQSKEVICFERTCSNRVNMQDISTPKVFISYKTVLGVETPCILTLLIRVRSKLITSLYIIIYHSLYIIQFTIITQYYNIL